jgi:hypothetical protein
MTATSYIINRNMTTRSSVTLEELINRRLIHFHIPSLTFIGLVVAIGLMGNTLVWYAYYHISKRTNHRVCILFLSILDIINVSLVAGPYKLSQLRMMYVFENEVPCKLFSFFAYFIAACEVAILTVVATDRYRKICQPHGKQMTEKQTKIVCGACVLIAFVLVTPLLEFQGEVFEHMEEYNLTITRCLISGAYRDSIAPKIYHGFQLVSVGGLFATMVVMYVLVGRQMYKQGKRKFVANISIRHKRKSRMNIAPKYTSDCIPLETDVLEPDDGDPCRSNTTASDDCTPMNPQKVSEAMTTTVQSIPASQVQDVPDALATTAESTPQNDAQDVSDTLMTPDKHIPVSQKHDVSDVMVTPVPSIPATKVSCMFFIITVLFLLSYTPYLVMKIASAIKLNLFTGLSRAAGTFYYLGYSCVFLNSMCNPIVYIIFDVQFKKECRRIYKAVKGSCVCGNDITA